MLVGGCCALLNFGRKLLLCITCYLVIVCCVVRVFVCVVCGWLSVVAGDKFDCCVVVDVSCRCALCVAVVACCCDW